MARGGEKSQRPHRKRAQAQEALNGMWVEKAAGQRGCCEDLIYSMWELEVPREGLDLRPYFANKEETKSQRPKGACLVPHGSGGSTGSG